MTQQATTTEFKRSAGMLILHRETVRQLVGDGGEPDHVARDYTKNCNTHQKSCLCATLDNSCLLTICGC